MEVMRLLDDKYTVNWVDIGPNKCWRRRRQRSRQMLDMGAHPDHSALVLAITCIYSWWKDARRSPRGPVHA